MRKPQLQLPTALTDRLPDAVSQRLPGAGSGRKLTAKRVAIGGGIFAVVTALAALGSTVARRRYVTGTAKVVEITKLDQGAIVVLGDGNVFWATDETLTVLDTYKGDGAPALSYKLDSLNRHRKTGLAVGTVNTDG